VTVGGAARCSAAHTLADKTKQKVARAWSAERTRAYASAEGTRSRADSHSRAAFALSFSSRGDREHPPQPPRATLSPDKDPSK